MAAEALPAPIGATPGEVGEERIGFGKIDAATLLAGGDVDSLGDEGLADAGRAAEEDRGVVLEVATTGQLPDARPRKLGVVGEVEVAGVAVIFKACLVDTPGDALALAARKCVVEEQEEEVERVEGDPTCLLAGGADGRTTHHPGYAISQWLRKRIEECFGWIKKVGTGRKLRSIGKAKNQLWGTLTAVALNLVRMVKIEAQPAP